MTSSHQLSDLQYALMRVLWDRGEATVSEVHELVSQERRLAMTTIATILTRLEKRGLVSHRRVARHYRYRARVSESEVRRSMMAELSERLFAGDVPEMVSHLLTESEISTGDLERVRALIEAKAQELDEDPPCTPPSPSRM